MSLGASPGDRAAQKRALRSRARRAAVSLSGPERVRRCRELETRLLAMPELARVGAVALYAPLSDEVQLEVLPRWLLERGCRLAYPRLEGDALSLHWVGDPEALRPGSRNLREPAVGSPAARPDALDVIVVPGLMFDRRGRRLGRGGGHYDRLMALLSPSTLSIGLCLTEQLVDELPSEAHDVPLLRIVTDREVLRIS